MIRQRVNLRTPGAGYLVRALTTVLALGLIWYGAMVVLLAAKVSPHTVNLLSGYRTLYNDVSNLHQHDFTSLVRVIGFVVGLIVFLLLLFLALAQFPRPYLARGEVRLGRQDQGRTLISPRAIERVAEVAAVGNSGVTAVSGRLGDGELSVAVTARRTDVADVLRDVRQRVRGALEQHELPSMPVNVTLTNLDQPRSTTRRELA